MSPLSRVCSGDGRGIEVLMAKVLCGGVHWGLLASTCSWPSPVVSDMLISQGDFCVIILGLLLPCDAAGF